MKFNCCSKRSKKYEKRLKKNKIQPICNDVQLIQNERPKTSYKKSRKVKKEEVELNKKQNEEFHQKFIQEIIPCGYCNKKFTLGCNELKIHCGNCNKFFHCYVAGKCNCDKCSVIINNKIEHLSYCLNCASTINCKPGFCKCN
jgi:hypothetical protein